MPRLWCMLHSGGCFTGPTLAMIRHAGKSVDADVERFSVDSTVHGISV
jgi:hypothetical protein